MQGISGNPHPWLFRVWYLIPGYLMDDDGSWRPKAAYPQSNHGNNGAAKSPLTNQAHLDMCLHPNSRTCLA